MIALTLPESDRQRWRLAIVVALVVHALLASMMALRLPRQRFSAPAETVPVDVIGEAEFERLTRRPPPPPPAAPSPDAPPLAAPVPPVAAPPQARPVPPAATPPAMIRAEKILSGEALAGPRNRKLREQLEALDDAERMVQICSVEAVAQILARRKDLAPDIVVAYARAEVAYERDAVIADGAAIRGGKRWYKLEFRCDLAPQHARVSAFAFHLGDAIPRRDWEDFSLPANGPDLD